MNALRSVAAGLVAGGATMYFLDPKRGNYRRAVGRDKIRSYLRSAAGALSVQARDVSNRTAGLVAEIRGALAEADVDDFRLGARLRARLGHVVHHPSAIKISANNGSVTLEGAIPANAVAEVMHAAGSVRGVQRVINRLTVDPGSPSSLRRLPASGLSGPYIEGWLATSPSIAVFAGLVLVGRLALGRFAPLALTAGGLYLAAKSCSHATSKVRRTRLATNPVRRTSEIEDPAVEKVPAVEWGERLFTGKTIARGGKTTGFVPGASA